MDSKKVFWLYLGGVVLAIVCLWLVWHFFREEIISAVCWLVLMATVFGAGWLMGRFSRRKAEDQEAAKLKNNK